MGDYSLRCSLFSTRAVIGSYGIAVWDIGRRQQFHAINGPRVSVSEVAVAPPEPGNLESDLLKVLCTALAAHTSTADSCWFCLWDGYGWLHDTGVSTAAPPRNIHLDRTQVITIRSRLPPTLTLPGGSPRVCSKKHTARSFETLIAHRKVAG